MRQSSEKRLKKKLKTLHLSHLVCERNSLTAEFTERRKHATRLRRTLKPLRCNDLLAAAVIFQTVSTHKKHLRIQLTNFRLPIQFRVKQNRFLKGVSRHKANRYDREMKPILC
jgi:hypothetical protein